LCNKALLRSNVTFDGQSFFDDRNRHCENLSVISGKSLILSSEFGTLRRQFKKLDRGHTFPEKLEDAALQASHSRMASATDVEVNVCDLQSSFKK
jgi:hypothetical protein